jgi:TetR/AcrR family transcriptional regulator, transcriptional repressor for nem operon
MVSRVREKIVSAAIDRFHALGFSACGIQEIVDKAGVPKGSFYNYFKAKELLALEVIEIWAKGSKREMLADTRLPPVERLRQHFEFLASRYEGFGYDKGCLLGNLAAECSDNMPLVRKALKQTLAGWTEAVSDAIREGQADGSISPDRHPEELARFLVNSWEGAVVRMKIVSSRQPLDDFFSVALPLVTTGRGIGAAKATPKKAATKRVKRKH